MRSLVCATVIGILCSVGTAFAQTAKPVELVPPRPVTVMPMPVPGMPLPTVITPTPVAPTPLITAPPVVVVPGAPTAPAAKKNQPKKCWCFVRNPATNSSQRTTCEVECCRNTNVDQRC